MEQKRKGTYVSLHNHSEYSNLRLIDSTNRYKRSIDYCWELGLGGIAMTEHDCLSGSLKFWNAWRAKLDKEWEALGIDGDKPDYEELSRIFDFKAIIGNEIYLSAEGLDGESIKAEDADRHFYHLILLAKDKEGLQQLRLLSSAAWKRSFMFKGLQRVPTYPSDLRSIVKGGHLICSTACLGGYVANRWKEAIAAKNGGDITEAQNQLSRLQEYCSEMEGIFGKGNFFIELQPNREGSEQNQYNQFMLRAFGSKYPFIFTTDSHYLKASEKKVHAAFLNSKSSSERELADFYDFTYFMSEQEVRELMPYASDEQFKNMVTNTRKIGEMCSYYSFERKPVIPMVDFEHFDEYKEDLDFFDVNDMDSYPTMKHHILEGNRSEQYLMELIAHGYIKKQQDDWNHDVYFARLEEELSTISAISKSLNQDMENYFITINKLVELMWQAGSLVGPSRGSAGASLILFLLEVIQIDPIKLDLPFFWRFMHPSRPDMADVDIDTETGKRQAVFDLSRNYFVKRGGDVVNVCTFGTEGTKSALKTAARGLDIDDDLVSYVTKMVPNSRGFDWTLSECYSGNGDDRQPISAFIEVMNQNPEWWELACAIEGLVTRLGVHASGVVCVNGDMNEYCSYMKTGKGQLVTAMELHDADLCGLIKYDYLTVSALDRIHQCMNYMLESGRMEWQGDLKSTYLKYLDPNTVLDYDTAEMWEMAAEGKISSLFQFDTVQGGQCMRKTRPQSLKQIAVANSLTRLMCDEGDQPIDIFVKHKLAPELWYSEMTEFGLNEDEQQLLTKYLGEKCGVADSQEVVMQLSMDPHISNFTMSEANKLRKTIAKKQFDQIEKVHALFNEKGLAAGTRQVMLDYVWNKQFKLSFGYSFSTVHTTGYSIIAVQEMNLAYHYPIIYWNCACLSVDASAVNDNDFENLIDQDVIVVNEDVEKKTINKMDYSKIATALSRVRKYCNISLPDINKSKLGFTPIEETNTILYGLKGISKVTDPAIEEIMKYRPFTSLDDFLTRTTKKVVSKDKVINLIKCGAFNQIEGTSTEEVLKKYIRKTSEPKSNLTMQNANGLIDAGLFPLSLDYQCQVYKVTKEFRKNRNAAKTHYFGDKIAIPTDKATMWKQIIKDSGCVVERIENRPAISSNMWDMFYTREMAKLKSFLTANLASVLQQYNDKLFQDEWDKYCQGGQLEWQLDSMNFFFDGHPLTNVVNDLPVRADRVDEIVEGEEDGQFVIKGKIIPKMKLFTLAGTVIDRDNTKSLVTIQNFDGNVVTMKVYKNLYAMLSKDDESTGEESFFEKGVHLLVTGIQRGATFVPKTYKNTGRDAVMRIRVTRDDDGSYHFGTLEGKTPEEA